MAQLNADSLAAVRKELAERSLRHFIRQGWRYIDPADYVANWHIDAISEHVEAVAKGELRHVLFNVPPRHMKSIGVSVAMPAWLWAQPTDDLKRRRLPLMGPQVGMMFASYAQSLSIRDSVKCRRLIDSPWYQDNWGDRFAFAPDQNTKTRYENDHQGYRIATSVDGALTGEGADIIGVDDAHNVREAESDAVRESVITWWDEAMSTRLNNPKTGAYIVIMQRVHTRDLAGHIIAKNNPDWTHLCLPARYEGDHPHRWFRDPRKEEGQLLWPARLGETEIETLETALGSYGAAGQLQQRPAPRAGGMFQRGWFKPIPLASVPATVTRKVRGWDFAATVERAGADPDWTAGVLAGKDTAPAAKGTYIFGVQRGRLSANDVQRLLVSTAALDGKFCRIRLPQDPGQAGKAQAETFKQMLGSYMVKVVPPTGDKTTRATPAAAAAEAGDVYIVVTGNPDQDAWIEPFLAELSTFPMGAHDDQVDAFADAFNELNLAPAPAQITKKRR